MTSSRQKLKLKLIDLCGAVLAPAAARIARLQWRWGAENMPRSFRAWNSRGVLPLPFHYYYPVFDADELPPSTWTRESLLPGIALQPERQLRLLEELRYADEVRQFPLDGNHKASFCYFNGMFGPGDAEVLYSVIRHFKPKRMVEIGSGCSTFLAKAALDRNRALGYQAEHICIEPYGAPWLEKLGVKVIRDLVENLDLALFEQLGANDILFIDSSHVVRTGGDVQFEYLEIVPRLQPGVLVHVHDIFLPFEYPMVFSRDMKLFWTEQYLVQAFLAFNTAFEIVLALRYLDAHHPEALARAAPVYGEYRNHKPASLWIRRCLRECK
ncbi:MAG: class I SAM-dependent methyltransferase [Terriglobales bacterium]